MTVLDMSTNVNPLNAELNPIRHLLALAGARPFVHVSRGRGKLKEIHKVLNIRPNTTYRPTTIVFFYIIYT